MIERIGYWIGYTMPTALVLVFCVLILRGDYLLAFAQAWGLIGVGMLENDRRRR